MNYQNIIEKYIDNYKSNNYNDENAELMQIRKLAYNNLINKDYNKFINNYYKHLNIFDLYDTNLITNNNYNVIDNLNDYFQCEVEALDTHLVLLSNGKVYEKQNLSIKQNENVVICSLSEAKQKHSKILLKYFNKYASQLDDFFINVNNMLANDGVFIYVPENVQVEKTIQIVNLTHNFDNKHIIKRNLIILEKKSSLSLVICDHTLNNSINYTIDLSETYVGENANYQIHTIQNEPNKSCLINSNCIELYRNANVKSFIISLNAGIIKNNIYAKFIEEGAELNLYGLNFIDKKQMLDNYTLIDHAFSNCNSTQLYKSIVDDEARNYFNGKIIVRKDAQKTNASQTNNNLCLSNSSKLRTKPQLEIYADDVKCSHGATIGQIDETALFYLRQRGINESEAKLMLMFAFANDILEKINIVALKNQISKIIEARLRGELSACKHCLLNCSLKD